MGLIETRKSLRGYELLGLLSEVIVILLEFQSMTSETGPVQVHQVQVQLLCTSFIYFVLYLNTFYLSIFYLVSVKSTNVLKYQYLSTRVKYHVYQ